MNSAHDRWSPPVRDPLDDTPRLECGVFGIHAVEAAAALTALGLHALQHRGQEACGIAAFDGQRFHTERHMGHVGDAFGGGDLDRRLPGRSGMAMVVSSSTRTKPGASPRGLQSAEPSPAAELATTQNGDSAMKSRQCWLSAGFSFSPR